MANLKLFKTELAIPLESRLPEIEVFEHINFNQNSGDERGFSFRTSFNVTFVGDRMNDKISSFIIYSGRWQFFQDINFGNPYPPILGPGQYFFVNDIGIPNDQISSYKCVSF
jgi:hypothetical protein